MQPRGDRGRDNLRWGPEHTSAPAQTIGAGEPMTKKHSLSPRTGQAAEHSHGKKCDSLAKHPRPGNRLIAIDGQTFGRWHVIERAGSDPNPRDKISTWLCRCSCGHVRPVRSRDLRQGKSKGCGRKYVSGAHP